MGGMWTASKIDTRQVFINSVACSSASDVTTCCVALAVATPSDIPINVHLISPYHRKLQNYTEQEHIFCIFPMWQPNKGHTQAEVFSHVLVAAAEPLLGGSTILHL